VRVFLTCVYTSQ